jgi:hypothetical protein
MNTPFTLIGITVSVQYEDYLSYCLSNAQILDQWYVVVDPTDTPTHHLLQGLPNVTMIQFEFRKGNTVFNKSGGLHEAQRLVHAKYPDAWVLLLDSDIVLPPETRTTLMNSPLDRTFLYGAARAFYQTPEQLQEDKPTSVKTRGCWGFFHLYFDKTKFCLAHSKDASGYDEVFKTAFARRIHILPITVKHLGDERCNWKGRKSKRFEVTS